ncbi:MAG: class I SAM-dependent DNA methyltransferase [Planctomycetes bacterium]|nr:class I SAM-dependent DNA methyltransferase [Planctomycetota bacterium]
MTPAEFAEKWAASDLRERQACQEHFLDLCRLVDHQTPVEADKTGESFCFDKGAAKHGGGDGWADVWKKGHFAWEYKGKRKDLDAAYDQLLMYPEALDNPPLLVVSDMDRIRVHTNFVNTPACVHEVRLDNLDSPRALEILRAVFDAPEKLRPGTTSQTITAEAAERIAQIALSLRARGTDPFVAARFLDRLIFCMFAEDVGLLPEQVFTRVVEKSKGRPEVFRKAVGLLFGAMAHGGLFGADELRNFDGHLFTDEEVVPLTEPELGSIRQAALLDWSAVDPSILGTLFERGLDPDKRSQLGAHYTSREDIERLVAPVVLQPLEREWAEVRAETEAVLRKRAELDGPKKTTPRMYVKLDAQAHLLVNNFLTRLAVVRVLDPACGSGNFLYVTLQLLKDLEKRVLLWAAEHKVGHFFPHVSPTQLYGIEINPYSFELAQMTVWIGHLQWMRANGYGSARDPVLLPLEGNFHNRDAILDLSDPARPREPEWPKADFIVGNPPFLGGKLLRSSLGDGYVNKLFETWKGRVPAEADLCCYWFEKARAQIAAGDCRRAGLLATQGIRGGANREVLRRIKETGDLFFAESDRDWILDGANVHISMVGFDGGGQKERTLNGTAAPEIYANLAADVDVTRVASLPENLGLSFMGDTKGGAFEIHEATALELLEQPNAHGLPNSDVLTPWVNGLDVTRRSRELWIIDFGVGRTEEEAAGYERPFEYLVKTVRPEREKNRRECYRNLWWQHVEARPAMRAALRPLPRFLATARVSKHRVFVWLRGPTLPDCQLIVFARSDDYFLGVLHSRVHEVWSRSQATQVREAESGTRYTPTSCFETFPFPWPPSKQPSKHPALDAIDAAARELETHRTRWLHPPEWVKPDLLEFLASAAGPWGRFLRKPDSEGLGLVQHARLVPRDDEAGRKVAKRTLTALYNERPAWLDLIHKKLDEAVFAAYAAATGDTSWTPGLTDEQLLGKLAALNRARSPGS